VASIGWWPPPLTFGRDSCSSDQQGAAIPYVGELQPLADVRGTHPLQI
jgi:hypothetical protein